MKAKKLLTAVLLSAAIFTGCKKDDAAPAPPPVTVDANGTITPPSDASGALYMIYNKTYDTHNSSSFEASTFGYAWFGAYTALKDAGMVTANTIELENFMNQYITTDPFITIVDPAVGTVNWSVEGNATSGISAFTHTDNTSFASGSTFTLPASLNINTSYTINNGAPGTADAVIYSVVGNKGQVNKGVAGSSTSYTFTAAELNEAAYANDVIGFSVMPVKISSATYHGKKYYFVKQYAHQRETLTQ